MTLSARPHRSPTGNLGPNRHSPPTIDICFSPGLRTSLWSILAMTAATGAAAPAMAQDAAPVQLDEIVVNAAKATTAAGWTNGPTGVSGYVADNVSGATKTNTPLVKVPQSVSVITRENLDDRNVQTLNQALDYTPGASTSVFGFDPRFEDVYIRGFDTLYNGVYRDGLRDLNAAGGGAAFRNEPYGLDAITVIAGPVGATYGYGSPGGIVDLTSKRPTFTRFGETSVQFGNFDRKQFNFDFGGPVDGTDGKVAYRLTGILRDSQTFPSGPDDRIDIAPSFTYQPDASTSFTFLGGYDRSRVPGNSSFYNGPNFQVTSIMSRDPAFDRIVQDQYRLGYAFEHKFSADTTFRQNVRFASLGMNWHYTETDSVNPDGISAARSTGLLYEKQSTIQVDNQVETHFSIGPTKHVLLAGLDYAHIDYAETYGYGTAPDLNLVTLNFGQQYIAPPAITDYDTQRQDQLGEYLQDQIEWGRFFLTLSGRHDTVRTSTTSDAVVTPQTDDAFTGRAGLNYRLMDGVYPYVSYATTFAPNLGVNAEGQAFAAQRGDQKEAGVKAQVPNTKLHLTGAVFEINESSVLQTDPNNLAFSVATGKVRSRGYELSAIDNIAPGTNVTASFTHFDLRYADDGQGLIGNQLSGIPGTSAKLYVEYRLPVAGPIGGLSLGGGVRHLGYSFADDANTAINKPVDLFDVGATYDFASLSPTMKGVRAQLNAYNVFDRYYTTCQAGFCYRGAPLQVIGSMSYRW